jgi:hypothetical protein
MFILIFNFLTVPLPSPLSTHRIVQESKTILDDEKTVGDNGLENDQVVYFNMKEKDADEWEELLVPAKDADTATAATTSATSSSTTAST